MRLHAFIDMILWKEKKLIEFQLTLSARVLFSTIF